MVAKSRLSPGMILFYAKQGFTRFSKKRYKDAIFSFNKALGHDPYLDCAEILKLEQVFSCLGRSYLALGKQAEALDSLNKAYDLFQEKKADFKDPGEREMLRETLKAYSDALAAAGQKDRANEIVREAEERS